MNVALRDRRRGRNTDFVPEQELTDLLSQWHDWLTSLSYKAALLCLMKSRQVLSRPCPDCRTSSAACLSLCSMAGKTPVATCRRTSSHRPGLPRLCVETLDPLAPYRAEKSVRTNCDSESPGGASLVPVVRRLCAVVSLAVADKPHTDSSCCPAMRLRPSRYGALDLLRQWHHVHHHLCLFARSNTVLEHWPRKDLHVDPPCSACI
jgi:hypothetical protein